MNKRKTILATGIATAGMASILLVGGVAFAQTNSGSSSLAQSIATKFNLNKDDVQKVIETQHQDMQKQHLDQLVKDGKITADQETKIIAKQAEMKPKMDAARDVTDPTARKTAMEAIRTEMQQWAKDNNIPKGIMGPRGEHGPGHRMGMMRGGGGQPESGPDAN